MRIEHDAPFAANVIDARPAGEGWLILTRNGRLGDREIDLSAFEGPLELHVSEGGRFAAVVERRGRRGRVFDLATGVSTLELDRGGYYPETSVFPVAFTERHGRTLLVHGTDWNRLDISDAESGELLTARSPTSFQEGEPEPPHYLDYFHAGLSVSPDGRWIAEDGWIWHPFGELRLWSIDEWLDGNVWESEDGASLRFLAQRRYFWDTPRVWLDDRRFAFWGEGDDENEMRAVVRIYDVEMGEETGRIEGPIVTPATAWGADAGRTGWLAFDPFLLAISPESGTEVWTLGGERLLHDPSFMPRRYHPVRREFLSWGDDEALASRLVP